MIAVRQYEPLHESRAIAQRLIEDGVVPSLDDCARRQADARASGDPVALALWSRLRWRALCAADPGAARRGFVPVTDRCLSWRSAHGVR